MGDNELSLVPDIGGGVSAEQRQKLQDAAALATQVKRIVSSNGLSRRFGSAAKEHVFVEGWLTISRVCNEQPHAKVAEVFAVPETGEQIIKAYGWLTDSRGAVVSEGDAYVSTAEPNWNNKPFYARASMAQTRAIGKAMRLRHAWVMVMAGYAPTPAEEMTEEMQDAHATVRNAPKPAPTPTKPAPAPEPQPPQRGAPTGNQEGPTGILNAVVGVAVVSAKRGVSKKGEPYTKYGIKGNDGVWYNTFSDTFADLATSCKKTGERVYIEYSQDQYGNTIETLTVHGAQPGGAA